MTGNGTPHTFKQADPCSLVVFGASGDLMHRLLVPALYNLAAGGLLPDAFALIGRRAPRNLVGPCIGPAIGCS